MLDEKNLQKLEELFLYLKLAEKGSIIFAVCNEPILQEKLYEEIEKRKFKGLYVYKIKMSKRRINLIKILKNVINSKKFKTIEKKNQKIAFFVENLEKAIPKAIGFLNYTRNSFEEIKFPIVIWCKDYVCDKIATESQDFWAWRSKVFEFRLEEKVLQSISAEMLSESIQYKDLNELNRRIKIYEDLIKEYKDREIKDDEKIAEFYSNLGFYYYVKGDYKKAMEYYELVLNSYKKEEVNTEVALAKLRIGLIHQDKGDYDEALKFYEKCKNDFKDLKDDLNYSETIGDIANIYRRKGNYDNAMKLYNESLKIKGELGDKLGIALINWGIAMIYDAKGEYDKSIKIYEECLKTFNELGDKMNISNVKHQIAMIYQDKGDYDNAMKLYNESLNLKEELGDKSGISATKHQIAMIYQLKGDYVNAMKLYDESLKIAEELGDKSGIALTLGNIGILYYKQKNYEKAVVNLLISFSILEKLESPDKDIFGRVLAIISKELGEEKFKEYGDKAMPKVIEYLKKQNFNLIVEKLEKEKKQ